MKQHLNTLFVTTQRAYLAKEGEAVVVRVEREPQLRVPLQNIGAIVCFGHVNCSPALMALCNENGVAISFLSETGRFRARVIGFSPGNVLLRRTQYRLADQPEQATAIVRPIVCAKLANARSVLSRAMRDYPNHTARDELDRATKRLSSNIDDTERVDEVAKLRGIEGDSANTYFGVFNHLITTDDGFAFTGRSRRPPLDKVNALLSFLYALLTHDARAACETAGLDAAVGYLHADRPGRPGLALDLMEALRPFLVDRLTLSLINRRQIQSTGFHTAENGAVTMDDATRKTVLTAYQKRKQETITHPFLGEKTTVGLIVHLQARLLARYVRGELDAYPAFLWK